MSACATKYGAEYMSVSSSVDDGSVYLSAHEWVHISSWNSGWGVWVRKPQTYIHHSGFAIGEQRQTYFLLLWVFVCDFWVLSFHMCMPVLFSITECDQSEQ